MQLFVYEYTCATMKSPALRAEGWAMLAALLADLRRVPGVEVCTLAEASTAELLSLLSGNVHVETCAADGEEGAFRRMAGRADGVLVIAPEFDGLLFHRCQWVEELGGQLLGPSSEAVALAGDKLMLAQYWRDRGINTPSTALAGSAWVDWPAVLKPRYGAGSQATFLVRNEEELTACEARAKQEGWQGELILQPYVPGSPCSACILVGPAGTVALPACRQHLSVDGRFRYLGGSLPLRADWAVRAEALAMRAVDVIPGLRGYVGVDLILGAASDGSEDAAIEINPRLTTSYLGLRQLAQANLAEAMLRVVQGEAAPRLNWRPGPVHFTTSEPEA